jgi:hypothetical protein
MDVEDWNRILKLVSGDTKDYSATSSRQEVLELRADLGLPDKGIGGVSSSSPLDTSDKAGSDALWAWR